MRKRVEAKNALEGYCVSIKHTLNDSNIQGKISEDEKSSLLNKITEIENWISSNPNAELSEFEAKQKDLERIVNPVMSKMYQGAGASSGPGCGPQGYQQQQQQGQGHSGPNVDEVD